MRIASGMIDSPCAGRSRPNASRVKPSSRWIAQISSWRSGGKDCAGLPTATQPIGSVCAVPTTLFTCTTPLILISARSPTRAPGNTEAPVAMKTSLPISQPFKWACGPMSTLSPTRHGRPGRPRTTAFSITMQSRPSTTCPVEPSAVTTAPNRIRAPGPTVTSPETTAFGATWADSSMRGRFPACSISIGGELRLRRRGGRVAAVQQVAHRGGVERGREEVALADVAAQAGHGIELALELDALGDDLHVERAAQLDHRADQSRVGRVLAEVLHERAVHLHGVDRELAQVGERRVAGAEVVDRDPHAELPQCLEVADDRLAVLHQHRLGDLQHQVLAVQPGGRQHASHLVDHVALALELAHRQVHAHVVGVAVRVLRLPALE